MKNFWRLFQVYLLKRHLHLQSFSIFLSLIDGYLNLVVIIKQYIGQCGSNTVFCISIRFLFYKLWTILFFYYWAWSSLTGLLATAATWKRKKLLKSCAELRDNFFQTLEWKYKINDTVFSLRHGRLNLPTFDQDLEQLYQLRWRKVLKTIIVLYIRKWKYNMMPYFYHLS